MYSVGVDIGATKINFVLLRKQQILKTKRIPTPETKKEIIRVLKENIKFLISGVKRVDGIGLGVPGPLNQKGDLILKPPNLKCLRNCRLAKIIEKDLKIKTVMDNDVNCFTLAEALLGAGKGAKIVFGITLGSGTGGGLAIDSQIYKGAFTTAIEVGHMTIKFDGPRCTCGNYGCFEEYTSERFFLRKGISPKLAEEKARKSNRKALKIFREYGQYLGIGISNIINLFDPEVIVIGGGIANSYKFFIPEVKKEIKKRVILPSSKRYVKIKKARLGDLAGAIGAALLLASRGDTKFKTLNPKQIQNTKFKIQNI